MSPVDSALLAGVGPDEARPSRRPDTTNNEVSPSFRENVASVPVKNDTTCRS